MKQSERVNFALVLVSGILEILDENAFLLFVVFINGGTMNKAADISMASESANLTIYIQQQRNMRVW